MERKIELRSIYKSFPGVQALDNVSFILQRGEVHALMGENGAGKSTLMKILAGLYHADRGTILVDGNPFRINNPQDAFLLGISMIHQELSPLPHLSVAENVFIGKEILRRWSRTIDRRRMIEETRRLFSELGIAIEPRRQMGELNVAETQLVEIAKALSFHSEILIMDEPTSALTDREIEKLMSIIEQLKAKEVSIIYITHKTHEVFRIADRVTVLRDGRTIDTRWIGGISRDELVSLMVGREFTEMFPKEPAEIGEVIFEVQNLTNSGLFSDVSFAVRRGEILGIAGLMGSGRTELVETIFGIRRRTSGRLLKDGREITIRHPQDAVRHGIALVPEDRKNMGLSLKRTVKENISLANLPKLSRFGIVRRNKEREVVDGFIRSLSIKTPSRNQTVGALSGGNQQKVVISKWLCTNADVIFFDEPTRGIDVGAKSEIHRIMCSLAKAGKAVVMISSELPEVTGMSDRVVVLYHGRVLGTYPIGEFTPEKILDAAANRPQGDRV